MRFLACFLFLAAGTAWAGESLLPKPVDIALPFASKPDADRSYVDVPIKTTADAFVIDFECDVPDAIGSITFYLRSGKGWYSYAVPEPDDLTSAEFPSGPRVQMEIAPAALTARIEGQPGPVKNADTIRFSIWRGASKDATVKLHDIRTVEYPIVAVIDESDEGREYGSQFLRQMSSAGISATSISQPSLTAEKLKTAKVVVLPLNYKLPPETVAVLQKFVENDGKLVAFYQLPPELMKTLGFEPGKYVKPPQDDTALNEIRFDRTGTDPFKRVPDLKQKSWNIVTGKAGGEFGAHVAAWWHDAAGRKTAYPALLVSERGAFFSHILTNEDRESKRKFLVELFGLYDSSFRYNAVVKAWKAAFNVGDSRTMTAEKRKTLEKRLLVELSRQGFAVDAATFAGNGANLRNLPELHDALMELREKLVREYCESVPAKTPEFRAWWEHAGLGAYPGDWDRTMKELSEAGFNAVISNLLWGGSAHYASDVLPRSPKFEKYGDQIEQAVAAGKKYGVEVHAWQVCYRLTGSPPEFIEAMKKAGRTQVSFDGKVGDWLCPSHPENIDLETATFVELARKYKGLDGIHYDYIRYPDNEHCYCDGCRERFTKESGSEEIKQWPKDVRRGGPLVDKYEQWRCDQVTKLVRRVHGEVKAIRSELKISAAVFSQYPGCRRGVSQDWPVWVDNGWLDFICPMNYTESPASFESLIERQKPLVKGRIPLYPGIGATATGIAMTPDRVVAQIENARKMDVPGFVIFNLDGRTIQKIPPFTKLGATKK